MKNTRRAWPIVGFWRSEVKAIFDSCYEMDGDAEDERTEVRATGVQEKFETEREKKTTSVCRRRFVSWKIGESPQFWHRAKKTRAS